MPAGPTRQRSSIDVDGAWGSLQHRFDRAVAAIAHPAGEPQLRRLHLDEGAIPDALHAAFDAKMNGAPGLGHDAIARQSVVSRPPSAP